MALWDNYAWALPLVPNIITIATMHVATVTNTQPYI